MQRRCSVAVVGAAVLAAIVAVAAWAGQTAQARERGGEARVKLIIAQQDKQEHKQEHKGDSADARFEQTKLEELTKLVSKRLRARLETAKIKQFSVETESPGTILVTARGGISQSLLAGIVVPHGRFALSPVESVGRRWTKLSARLPAGVEIRQEEGSLSADKAYLFSRSRKKLADAVAKADFEDSSVHLYPQGAGWRTLTLAQPVVTHDDISGATIRHGKTGDVYVEVRFRHTVTTAATSPRQPRTFAAVLDGEVVATFQRLDADFGDALTVSAPEHLGSKTTRRMWAQQVAGRLAAFMPVSLIEMPDE